MKISRESWIIAVLGTADLVTTLIWVHYHHAQEANPLFARYLAMGSGWFALMKLVLLAAPILVLEWARRHRPVFTRWASRFAIVAYLGLYGIGVIKLNAPEPPSYRPNGAYMAMLGPPVPLPYLMPSFYMPYGMVPFMPFGNGMFYGHPYHGHPYHRGTPIASSRW